MWLKQVHPVDQILIWTLQTSLVNVSASAMLDSNSGNIIIPALVRIIYNYIERAVILTSCNSIFNTKYQN